jgi:hypothetical protein
MPGPLGKTSEKPGVPFKYHHSLKQNLLELCRSMKSANFWQNANHRRHNTQPYFTKSSFRMRKLQLSNEWQHMKSTFRKHKTNLWHWKMDPFSSYNSE